MELDERAAQKILDNPKYSLMVRDNANRKLRQCAARRHEVYPTLHRPDGERSTTSDAAEPDDSFAVLHKPFQSRHAKGTPAYAQEYKDWMRRCRLADEEERTKLRRENPAEYARRVQAIHDAERKRLADFDCFGHPIGPRAKPSLQTHDDGSFIASPAQKKAWVEQSRKFARLRGEVMDGPAPPIVKMSKPNRSIAYRLALDGFLFWPDNTPCESPLPAGTRIAQAPTPPYYHANDRSIPAGLKFNPIAFLWESVQ